MDTSNDPTETASESASNDHLLKLNHEIRQTEHALGVARRRRKWSNLSLAFGPILAVVLYAVFWIPWVSVTLMLAVYIPLVPVVVGFCVAAYRLKRNPGGPLVQKEGRGSIRQSESQLELVLARQRDNRKSLIASSQVSTKIRRIAYKEDAYNEIDTFRTESTGYRRVNNVLQGVIIVGSLIATGSSGVATLFSSFRWATAGITLAIGIASGFMGYYKYKERSFYLQQTADSIEQEWEAVEIGVGRYKHVKNEDEALAEFVEEVHRLKSEQKKREQNLEQPPDVRDVNE